MQDKLTWSLKVLDIKSSSATFISLTSTPVGGIRDLLPGLCSRAVSTGLFVQMTRHTSSPASASEKSSPMLTDPLDLWSQAPSSKPNGSPSADWTFSSSGGRFYGRLSLEAICEEMHTFGMRSSAS